MKRNDMTENSVLRLVSGEHGTQSTRPAPSAQTVVLRVSEV